jgi:hypothetical protein
VGSAILLVCVIGGAVLGLLSSVFDMFDFDKPKTHDSYVPRGDASGCSHDWEYDRIESNGNTYRTCRHCGRTESLIGSMWN